MAFPIAALHASSSCYSSVRQTAFQVNRFAVGSFLLGVVCFLLALACFLAETVIATRLLNFHMLR